MFNFWWSDERSEQKTLTKMFKKPKKGPLSHQKIKCSFLDTVQLLMIGWAIQAKNVNWNAKKWKRPPKSSKIKMFVFGLHSTSHDRPIWSMDLNPICHPSPANKMKCSFLDYIQLLMICQAGQWTWTPSATPLQPKKWNAHFWIMSNSWWLAGLVDGLEPHLPPLSSQKNEMLIFGLHSTSDDLPGWSMDLNPIWPLSNQKNEMLIFGLCPTGWLMDSKCHPSPAKKMKCSFLDYIQLLMIGQAGQWTRTPNPAKKMKCSFLDYIQLLMIGRWSKQKMSTKM